MVLVQILFLLVLSKGALSVCEESHIVICDDLLDVKKNDTWTWRYVRVGSDNFKRDPPRHTWESIFDFVNVKSLTIISQINFIKPLGLTRLSNMEYLNLYDNELKEIEDYTFANVPKLNDLILENNQIEHLGRSIFKNNTLDYVSLSRNQLESITTAFLECRIKWLKINHNKLTFIKAKSFPASLERLELDHNLLVSLEAEVFHNLHDLKSLSIKHNRLTALPDISALTKIQHLHLSYNKIGSADYRFDRHKDLAFLDLSSNLMRDFDVTTVSSNSSPPLVLLMFNRLTNLNFVDPSKKTDLALFGNPLVCDCYFKIEKVVKDYNHLRSCDWNFDKSELPVCINNGKCGEKGVLETDVDNFLKTVNVSPDKEACNFNF